MLKFCKLLFLLLFIIFLNNFTFSQTLPELEKVKEIKLLEHTREDVRRILADYKLLPNTNNKSEETFETDNVEIDISYSKGRCNFENGISYDWNVSENKANFIRIRPKKTILIENIGIDLSKVKKEQMYKNIVGLYLYHNKDEGLSYEISENEMRVINIIPPKSKMLLACDKKNARKFYLSKNWFNTSLRKRIYYSCSNIPSDVVELTLNVSEFTTTCSDSENKSCLDTDFTVSVFTYAKDPENDTMDYLYQITGGKIIGNGAKVLWDLSDVKPGTYTITAAVDDGCGFCGKTMTKTVTVKMCPNCKKP